MGRRRRSRACCDGYARNAGLLRLAAKEMPGRSLVPPVLHEDVLHVAVPVDSPPQILVSQERSFSVTTTHGTARVFFIRRRKKRLATALSRRFCAKMSRTLPFWSTARHRYFRSPLLLISTSTRCHLPPGRERLRRSPDGQRSRRAGRVGRPRHHAAVAAPDGPGKELTLASYAKDPRCTAMAEALVPLLRRNCPEGAGDSAARAR